MNKALYANILWALNPLILSLFIDDNLKASDYVGLTVLAFTCAVFTVPFLKFNFRELSPTHYFNCKIILLGLNKAFGYYCFIRFSTGEFKVLGLCLNNLWPFYIWFFLPLLLFNRLPKISKLSILSFTCAIFGYYLLITSYPNIQKFSITSEGFLFGGLSGISGFLNTYLYLLLEKDSKFNQTQTFVPYLFSCWICIVVFAVFFSIFFDPITISFFKPKYLFATAFSGSISFSLGHYLWFKGANKINPEQLGYIGLISIIAGPLMLALFYQDESNPLLFLSLTLIITANILHKRATS